MQWTFREEPQPDDVAAIARLVTETGFFRPDEVAVAAELVEERLAKGIACGYHFWLAELGGSLAGYVCYGPIPCTVGSFDLYWIAVDRECQGRGLGLDLTARAERSASAVGGRSMYVETSGKDLYHATRAFYRKAGYTEAARLADFYEPGDDKIIYRKHL